MPRHLKSRAGSGQVDATARLDAFLGPASKRKKRPSAGARRREYIDEVRERMRTKDMAGMTPTKLVALYWLCHERTYGTAPVEIDKANMWTRATMHAATMVKNHFDGEIDNAIAFMRWVWTRELQREEWRRSNGKGGRRITWQMQFVYDNLISDWRAAQMRRAGG